MKEGDRLGTQIWKNQPNFNNVESFSGNPMEGFMNVKVDMGSGSRIDCAIPGIIAAVTGASVPCCWCLLRGRPRDLHQLGGLETGERGSDVLIC